MSPAHALAHAALDHGTVVRRWAITVDDEGVREIGAAWRTLLATARLFADEHGLDEVQMYAVLDAVVNASAVTYAATITTERNP